MIKKSVVQSILQLHSFCEKLSKNFCKLLNATTDYTFDAKSLNQWKIEHLCAKKYDWQLFYYHG